MRASVFTPTHKPDWLQDCYSSLKTQTLQDFEWVLVPNGGANIPENIAADPRVRLCPLPSCVDPGVGALKQYACRQCQGDILVELDHDDMLVETCLEKISAAAEANPQAGFFYSDFVQFLPDGNSHVFDGAWGWEAYPFRWHDHDYQAMRAFPPTPWALANISFAPNHVRAWTKEAYRKSGEHSPTMVLCDDLDLIIRTSLRGYAFVHIREPLYMYREQPGWANTSHSRHAEIRAMSQKLCNRNFHQLLEAWCQLHALSDLTLFHLETNPQTVVEYLQRLPDNSVGYIRAMEYLHRLAPQDIAPFMNEAYRALVPGGFLLASVPSADGRGGHVHPGARSLWCADTFRHFTDAAWNANFFPEATCRFQATRLWDEHPSPWHKEHNILMTYADLCALKGQRQPDLKQWT